MNPDAKVTAGVAGRPNPVSNVTVMVLGAARMPVAEVVKPTVQVDSAKVRFEPGVKVAPLGEVPITTGEAGLAAAVSWVVATLNRLGP